MTHHTDAERQAFEAVASDDGKWPQAIERDADGNYLLMQTASGWAWWQVAWQAARRAPAAPVPQSEPVAYLWQHCETGRTRVVMPDMVITADANWIVVGPLYLAAAPRSPAAPVELPEHTTSEYSKPMCGAAPKVDPIAWYVTGCSTMLDEHDAKAEAKRCGGCAQAVPLYTEQQVRDLLAAHGIQERST